MRGVTRRGWWRSLRARFRAALDRGPDVIEYRAVEIEGSRADAAHAADYRTFRVVRHADLWISPAYTGMNRTVKPTAI